MNLVRHTLLGLFFFATIVLLGIVTIYLGDVTTKADRITLSAYFATVEGLGKGDPVMVYGVQQGRVIEVAFTPGSPPPERRLRVTFVVDQQLTLRKGYSIAIGSPSLLGGRQIELLAGEGEPLATAEYEQLQGVADANLMRNLAGILDENRGDVHRILSSVANMAEDVDQGRRSLADLALSKEANADLSASLRGAREAIDSANQFFKDGGALLSDARTQGGAIQTIVYDAEFASRLKGGVAGFAAAGERLGRGEGLLGKLTTDASDAAWNDFAALAADGRALVGDVRAGKGAVGRLFSDPAMEEQIGTIVTRFSGIANDAAAILDAARRGRGVLGLLVADDEARRSVERIIDQVGRAIEDAREAAPVSSVASFLFGNL